MSLDGQPTEGIEFTQYRFRRDFQLNELKEQTFYGAEVEKDKDPTEYNPKNGLQLEKCQSLISTISKKVQDTKNNAFVL